MKQQKQSRSPDGGWRKRDNTLFSSFRGPKQARVAVKRNKQYDATNGAAKALGEALRAL
ncbi:hypothetical protein CPT_Phriendly_004 [Vibrio phage Phriendly]|nr:hypothetical protein CPT_Phriendly_004 [Vibrio phage Phriendly]